MKIYDVICSKSWESYGAVLNSDPLYRRFYPWCGDTFTAVTLGSPATFAPTTVDSWVKDSNGKYKKETPVTKLPNRERRFLKLAINQSNHVDPDNPANRPPLMDADFKQKFEAARFWETGDNYLVSSALHDIQIYDAAGNPLRRESVNYVIELVWHPDYKRLSMVQRSFWSSGYLGTYCCG